MSKETEVLDRLTEPILVKVYEMAKNAMARSTETETLVRSQTLAWAREAIREVFKEAGGVFLDPDQSLPTVYEIQRAFTGLDWSTCENLQRWFTGILANFKRIKKLEGEVR